MSSPTVPHRPPSSSIVLCHPPPSSAVSRCFPLFPAIPCRPPPSPAVLCSYLPSPGRSCLRSWGSSSLPMMAVLGIQGRGRTTFCRPVPSGGLGSPATGPYGAPPTAENTAASYGGTLKYRQVTIFSVTGYLRLCMQSFHYLSGP